MTDTARTLTTINDLDTAGLLPDGDRAHLAEVASRYAVAVTPAMAALIDAGETAIARQFLPDARELATHPAEAADPIGDNRHSPVPGIVHRHRDRVLLKIVGACPVYCRFCFRREMIGPGNPALLPPEEIAQAIAYIAEHPEIWEVILTGGDPLILSPRRIAALMAQLAAIPHVTVIRWHTRVPVVAHERITEDLIAAMRTPGKSVILALHANHPAELTPGARTAIARLVDAGIPVVSQTVLLRGINDDLETLSALMRAFVAARVTPYYLHHGDRAPGTSHFRMPLAHGRALALALRASLSGLCQPTYVLDLPGGYGKIPVLGPQVREIAPGHYEIEDAEGRIHTYTDATSTT